MAQPVTFTQKPLIVGLGEVLWDLLLDENGNLDQRRLGGAPANFAFHANQLGAQGVVLSAIGRDPDGQAIESRFQELGLTTAYLRHLDRPTGQVTIVVDRARRHRFTIHPDVAWDFLPYDPELDALAQRADAVCFGTLAHRAAPSRQSIQAFLQATRRDCWCICDVNLREPFYDAENNSAGPDSRRCAQTE